MTKGEEASISIILTTIIPQKPFKYLGSAATVIAQSRETEERVTESWEEITMTPP